MALKFTLKTERVEFADGDYVEVRGLALPDISALVDAHTATAVEIFDRFTGRAADPFTNDDAGTLAKELLLKFPAISTHVIALAADAVDKFDEIKLLPPDVQVACLEKIGNLTFQMQGGLGNFVETVLRLVRAGNGLSAKLKSRPNSQNGSTASIGK